MKFNSQRGFTLVEVLTVMLVLVAIASITVESTKDFVFQGRYDITKDRYEKIKKAIIGDPNQVINGQSNIEGFVKDMGRLPRNLHELLVQNYCDNDYRISDNTPDANGITGATGTTPKEWCESKTPTAGIWIRQNCSDDTQPDQATCEGAGKIWREWKRKYVETAQPDYESNALPDGWGNSASTTDFTDQNYGWNFVNSTTTLNIQSKGKNGNINTADTGYDEDYPKATALPSIKHSDWTVDINGLKPLINAFYNGSCNAATCSDPIYKTQASCQTPRAVWSSGTCSNTFYTNQTDCETLRGTWSTAPFTTSKLNCEAGGAQWTLAQQNIVLKVNAVPSNTSSVITEDGREHLVSFSFTNHVISMGQVTVGVYYASDPNLSYPSICTNTNNHVNFTQANCVANTGSWKDDGTEQYCYGLNQALKCTGTTSPELGGTLKSEINLTLYPNTTLPTINW